MNDRDEMASAPTGESSSMGSSLSGPTSAKQSDSDQRVASQISASHPPSIPDYELLRRIGGGSYGEVWLARSATGVLRALKIVWRHTFEDDRPVQREFEGIQGFERLSREHPSQLALFHVGRGEGHFFYVIELADAAVVAEEKRGWGEGEQIPSAPFPPFPSASEGSRLTFEDQ